MQGTSIRLPLQLVEAGLWGLGLLRAMAGGSWAPCGEAMAHPGPWRLLSAEGLALALLALHLLPCRSQSGVPTMPVAPTIKHSPQ